MFEHCSYPQSNLGDFSDFLNPGGVPVWQQLGYASKAAWVAEGRRTDGATTGTPIFVPPAGLPTIGSGGATSGGGSPIASDSGAAAVGADAAAAGPVASGGLLDSIPSSWLLIGGAIVLLMVMKK